MGIYEAFLQVPPVSETSIFLRVSPVVSPYGSKSRSGCLSCVSLGTHEFHTMFNTEPVLRVGAGCVYPIEEETPVSLLVKGSEPTRQRNGVRLQVRTGC